MTFIQSCCFEYLPLIPQTDQRIMRLLVVSFQSYRSSIQISHEVPGLGDIVDGLKDQLLGQLIFQKTFQIPEA
jgi:hypothetical protein